MSVARLGRCDCIRQKLSNFAIRLRQELQADFKLSWQLWCVVVELQLVRLWHDDLEFCLTDFVQLCLNVLKVIVAFDIVRVGIRIPLWRRSSQCASSMSTSRSPKMALWSSILSSK
jgi:hypothetical protein